MDRASFVCAMRASRRPSARRSSRLEKFRRQPRSLRGVDTTQWHPKVMRNYFSRRYVVSEQGFDGSAISRELRMRRAAQLLGLLQFRTPYTLRPAINGALVSRT